MTTQEPTSPNLTLALAGALAERLCHDLAGIAGTVGSALDLAAQDPDMHDEALDMAREAATTLSLRLRLLRAAWSAGSGGLALAGAELRALAMGLPLGRRMRAELQGLAPTRRFGPGAARLILTLLLLAAESLHGEGCIALDEAPGGSLLLSITGPRAAWPTGLMSLFASPEEAALAARACSPKTLLAPLSALLAQTSGLAVSPLLTPTGHAPPKLRIAIA